jgi:transmembrane sensor
VLRIFVVGGFRKGQVVAAMDEDEISGGPRKAAIRWWTRLDAAPPSPKEQQDFVDWLTRDPANRAAFEEICCLWGDLEIVRPLITTLPRDASPRRVFAEKAAIGAGLAAVAFTLFLFSDDIWILLRAQMRTGAAETRIVNLPDGSRIELGPWSAIATDFDEKKRSLTLLKGEAWFDVAPDAARPFSVSVAGGAVTALGTAFDISTDRGRTEVTVAKHRVRVASSGPAIVVSEGMQSAFSPGVTAVDPYPVEVDHVTAWRRGKLIFDDKPLGEVVSILGRYHHGYILIVDPAIRARRVTGVFDSAQPMAAIQAIEKALGLRALYLGYLVTLAG